MLRKELKISARRIERFESRSCRSLFSIVVSFNFYTGSKTTETTRLDDSKWGDPCAKCSCADAEKKDVFEEN
jgi:hypothetical protein